MDLFIYTFVVSFGLSPVFSLSAYRYEFLDSVDGLYGNPTDDGQNASGMVGMVMRGVGNMSRKKRITFNLQVRLHSDKLYFICQILQILCSAILIKNFVDIQ